MKTGIITHYDVHNHGAVLQLFALVKVLRLKGIEAGALKFDKNYDFLGVKLKSKYEVSLKSIGYYLKYLFTEGFRKTLYNIRKRKILNQFKETYSLVWKEYYSSAKDIDATIIGSDEVFALHTGPTPIMFGHAAPSDIVFSYAASFGPTKYEDICIRRCIPLISSGLASMQGISVRDKNSYEIVKKLTSKTSEIVCDPVILYGFTHEIEAAQRTRLSDYLLVYAYDNRMNDPSEVKAIKLFAEKHGLKTLSPGFYHAWCDYNVNVDPIELLGYFKYSKYVITDTFHGSVMSIITKSQFAVKMRDNGNKLMNLLSEYCLENRIVCSMDRLNEIFSSEIDFSSIENEVLKRRNSSMEFLEKMLMSAK